MRFTRLVAVAALVVLANACSLVGADTEPRTLDDFPDDLFSTTTSAPSTTAVTPAFEQPLYFVNSGDQLVRINREVNAKPTIEEALMELLLGPSDEESLLDENGVFSRLPQDMWPPDTAAEVQDIDGVLDVIVTGPNLRAAANDTPERVRLVYTQIVCTIDAIYRNNADEDAEINTQVRISDAGGQIPVQTATDVVDNGSVGPADFNNCETAEEAAAVLAEAAEEENGENGDDEEPSSPTTSRNPTSSSTTGPNAS